jgi:hypothetical protein
LIVGWVFFFLCFRIGRAKKRQYCWWVSGSTHISVFHSYWGMVGSIAQHVSAVTVHVGQSLVGALGAWDNIIWNTINLWFYHHWRCGSFLKHMEFWVSDQQRGLRLAKCWPSLKWWIHWDEPLRTWQGLLETRCHSNWFCSSDPAFQRIQSTIATVKSKNIDSTYNIYFDFTRSESEHCQAVRLAFAGGQLEEATPGRPHHRRLVSGYISGNAELFK